jgi:four helix bundle protein
MSPAFDWYMEAQPWSLRWTAMMPYERFEAWQLCHQLVLQVYRATRSFPSEERYGLTSQAGRAAFSAAANIAEGAGKRGPREFRRFLDISLGSLSELSYILRLARELGILAPPEWSSIDELRNRAGQVTWRLAQSLSVVPQRNPS